MKIGELAEKAGVNIQTIRFYEREQILREPPRTSSGYRSYAEKDLQQVMFVKVCQSLGFTLHEIRQLAGFHSSLGKAPNACDKPLQEICALAAERLRIVDDKIAALQAMRQSLVDLLNQPTECPSVKFSDHEKNDCS